VAIRLRRADGTEMTDLCEFGSEAGMEACRTALLGSDAALWPGVFEVLSVWADVTDALEVIVSAASEKALTAAVTAAVELAGHAQDSDRERCEELLKRLQIEAGNERDRERVAIALHEMSKLDDYIMLWEIAGPFAQAGVDVRGLFGTEFAPESGRAKKRIRWQ